MRTSRFTNLFCKKLRNKAFRACENSKTLILLKKLIHYDCYHLFLDVVFYKRDNKVKSTKNLQRAMLQPWVKACAFKILDKLTNIEDNLSGILKSVLSRTLTRQIEEKNIHDEKISKLKSCKTMHNYR